MDGERKVNIVKLGELKLNDYQVLVINKTDYSGEDKIDFRVWSNSPKYKGPTKQGFVLTMDKMNEFVSIVDRIKENLTEIQPDKKKNKSKEQ